MTSSEDQQIDEGYRPARYFGPAHLESHLRTTIKGAERREMGASILRDGDVPLPVGLAEPGLSDDARVSWGAIHPSMMGGEYLPDRRGRELEIARITIQSTTQDVTCVYAFQGRGRLRYRVVDEYDGDCLQGRVRRTSSRPLTLGELTDFLLGAWNLIQILQRNFSRADSSLDEALAFFRGESAFYPDFDALLRSRVKAWWTDTRGEQSKADDRHARWMEVIIPADLIRAYEAADYWVEAPAGRMVMKIGQPFQGIDGVPGLNRLAIVTAYNPFSQTVGAARNAEKQAELVEAVERAGLKWLHAAGADATGEWPPEPSLAILDPTDPQLDRWMEMFGQNAVVVAECSGLAALRLHPRHKSDHAVAAGELAHPPHSLLGFDLQVAKVLLDRGAFNSSSLTTQPLPANGRFQTVWECLDGTFVTHLHSWSTGMGYMAKGGSYAAHFKQPLPSWARLMPPMVCWRLCDVALRADQPLPASCPQLGNVEAICARIVAVAEGATLFSSD